MALPLPADKPGRYWRDADFDQLKKYAQQAILIDGSVPMTGTLITPGVDSASGDLTIGGTNATSVKLGHTGIPTYVHNTYAGYSPLQAVYACAGVQTAQNLTNNAATRVNFDGVTRDTHNAITTGANWAFKAPVAGLYHVSASVSVELVSGTPGASEWTVDGPGLGRLVDDNRPGGYTYVGFSASTDVQLNVNDSIYLTMYHNTGATYRFRFYSSRGPAQISIHRIPGS